MTLKSCSEEVLNLRCTYIIYIRESCGIMQYVYMQLKTHLTVPGITEVFGHCLVLFYVIYLRQFNFKALKFCSICSLYDYFTHYLEKGAKPGESFRSSPVIF